MLLVGIPLRFLNNITWKSVGCSALTKKGSLLRWAYSVHP